MAIIAICSCARPRGVGAAAQLTNAAQRLRKKELKDLIRHRLLRPLTDQPAEVVDRACHAVHYDLLYAKALLG
jgi:hypothetical protein